MVNINWAHLFSENNVVLTDIFVTVRGHITILSFIISSSALSSKIASDKNVVCSIECSFLLKRTRVTHQGQHWWDYIFWACIFFFRFVTFQSCQQWLNFCCEMNNKWTNWISKKKKSQMWIKTFKHFIYALVS